MEDEAPAPGVLAHMGWRMHATPNGRAYYHHKARKEAAWDLPYYELLGLSPKEYENIGKADISAAFFARRLAYTQPLSKELKDPATEEDWRMIVEAFQTLTDPTRRVVYEQKNLTPNGRRQLCSILAIHSPYPAR